MIPEEIVNKANVERAFVVTVMQALEYYIDNMLAYCKENNLRVDSFEKSQLNIMKKAINYITIEYRQLNNGRGQAFKDYSKILAVTVQELFSRVDGDYMRMYKFYNYIKAFPNQRHEIEVPAEIEQEAFSVLFNNNNNEDNTTQS